MSTKLLQNLWRDYPRSRLHCDVTRAGLNSFQVVVSLIGSDDEVICSITHYGSGQLETIKEEAFKKLVDALKERVEG